jgi:hypothetical protein
MERMLPHGSTGSEGRQAGERTSEEQEKQKEATHVEGSQRMPESPL